VAHSSKADGRSVRWDAHRLTRRAELVQAAMVAVERHGASVGMDQIAAVAGTSKAVFYRHFSDKADLYRAVGQQMAQSFRDQLGDRISSAHDPRSMVATGIDTYLSMLEKAPELYRFVVRNPILEQAGGAGAVDYTGIIAARVDDLIRQITHAGGDGAMGKPWGTAIVGFMKSAGDWWLDHPGVLTRAELTESLTGLLWNGAAALQTPNDKPTKESR
jgi:AcrR family transcriptional regulator